MKFRFQPIGLRIIKSAVAIALCYLISFIRGGSGIVFYSQLAALWCIQGYIANSRKNALQRFQGTVIGALYGLVYLLVEQRVPAMSEDVLKSQILDSAIISLMIIVVLYTTVLIKKKQASYFSCVVFLSIVVNHVADANPYLFVWNRFLDTLIGIAVGIGVNTFSLPREKRKDILFISGLDDTLVFGDDHLSDYSRIELNRMLDEGANFTISTMRTPASLIEPLHDIRIKLPVIVMDGAALYDIRENAYLMQYVISNSMSKEILCLLEEQGLCCFTNVIVDDLLLIYYKETEDPVHQELVRKLRRSPYRNYVKSESLEHQNVVYFMLLYPDEVIQRCYTVLKERGYLQKLKVLCYASTDYPGYSYIKIYNRNATRDNMNSYLKNMLNLQKTVTFGSIPEKYDVYIEEGNVNKVVQVLKKMYEPVKRPF